MSTPFNVVSGAIALWPVERVLPYPGNPRTHTSEEAHKLAAHIRRHGFNKPIEVDEAGVILCGHRRLAAALLLGMAEVPVIQHLHLTLAQKIEYRLADNRLTLEGEWDGMLLNREVEALLEDGGDAEFTGFEPGEVEEMLADLEGEPEEVPARTPRVDYSVVVQCRSAREVERVRARLERLGYTCRAVS